jgi:hypothetical protein
MLVIVMLRSLSTNSIWKAFTLERQGRKRNIERDTHEAPEAPRMSAPSKQRNGIGLMRYQNKIKIQRRRVRKLFWLFAAAAVCALLFEEQAAVLYVVSTLATCGLLIVVAISNLEARDAEMQGVRKKRKGMTINRMFPGKSLERT